MERHIDTALDGIAKSQKELVRSLSAESYIVLRMAERLRSVPAHSFPTSPNEPCPAAALAFAKQIGAYLHTLGALEDALADKVEAVLKELRRGGEDE
jgi:phage gp29-like protein